MKTTTDTTENTTLPRQLVPVRRIGVSSLVATILNYHYMDPDGGVRKTFRTCPRTPAFETATGWEFKTDTATVRIFWENDGLDSDGDPLEEGWAWRATSGDGFVLIETGAFDTLADLWAIEAEWLSKRTR